MLLAMLLITKRHMYLYSMPLYALLSVYSYMINKFTYYQQCYNVVNSGYK